MEIERGELEQMKVEQMAVGIHGTEAEVQFALKILKLIRKTGYKEEVYLIGSRARGQWISDKTASTAFLGSSLEERDFWINRLTEEAKARNLCRKEIPTLLDILPDLPPKAKKLLEGFSLGEGSFETLEAGSDIDLVLKKRPESVRERYEDSNTGQIIEVWEEQEMNPNAKKKWLAYY